MNAVLVIHYVPAGRQRMYRNLLQNFGTLCYWFRIFEWREMGSLCGQYETKIGLRSPKGELYARWGRVPYCVMYWVSTSCTGYVFEQDSSEGTMISECNDSEAMEIGTLRADLSHEFSDSQKEDMKNNACFKCHRVGCRSWKRSKNTTWPKETRAIATRKYCGKDFWVKRGNCLWGKQEGSSEL